jgi:hypothetical protein
VTGRANRPFRAIIAAAVLVPAVWLILNAARPLHYDDPQFLLWAKAIAPMQGDGVPALVNWEKYGETLGDSYAHYPPGWAILLAGLRRLAGDSPFGLRALEWPLSAVFLFACALLGARAGAPPWTVFWLAATSPLFLLSALNVMPDLGCFAFAVLGLALWTGGGPVARLAGAACLVLSGQLKQTALPLFGLLLLPGPDGRRPRLRDLAIAGAAGLFSCWYPRVVPGASSGTAGEHAWWVLAYAWEPALLLPKAGYLLAVCAATVAFPAGWIVADYSRRRPGRGVVGGAAAVLVLALLGAWKYVRLPNGSVAPVPAGWEAVWFVSAIALFLGWAASALPAAARSPAGRWLLAWLVLTTAGYAAGAPFPACRFLIGLLPPLAILLAPALAGRRGAFAAVLAGNVWLSASLAHGDFRLAAFLRDAANRGAALAAGRHVPLVTTGQWGFRYSVELAGGRILGSPVEPLPAGAILLVPETIPQLVLPPALAARSIVLETWTGEPSVWQTSVFPVRPLATRAHSASFQGGHCWLPYAVSRGSVERVTAYLVRGVHRR